MTYTMKRHPRTRTRRPRRKLAAGPKALKMVKKLKRFVSPELKFFDTDASTLILTTPTIIDFNLIPQGDSVINRTGNLIRPQSLNLRFIMAKAAAATNTFVRVLIFRALNNQAVTPSPGDILQALTIDSPHEWVMKKRSNILYDRTFYLGPGDRQGHHVHKIVSLKSKTINYFGSGTGTPETNGIYMMLLSNELTNGPTMDWYGRMSFTDC